MENKISDEIICRVFAQYPKSPIVICEPNTEPVSHYLEGVDFNLNQIIAERVNYNPQWIKLILKPLSEISNIDAHEVALMLGMTDNFYNLYRRDDAIVFSTLGTSAILFFNGQIYPNYNDKLRTVHEHIESIWMRNAYEFIKQKGYDAPNYLLGGKTLHEAGLAIYK